jgi:hypothetical protein
MKLNITRNGKNAFKIKELRGSDFILFLDKEIKLRYENSKIIAYCYLSSFAQITCSVKKNSKNADEN